MTSAVRAGLLAAVVSGAPSTLYAVVTRRPLLEATEAAGSILLPDETRASRLVPAAGAVHVALSLFWSHVLARALPRGRPVLWGSTAGIAVAILDLLILGRRWEKIRDLPLAPQFADHVAFGLAVALALEASRDDAPSGAAQRKRWQLSCRRGRGSYRPTR